MTNTAQYPLHEYLDKLASDAPTPGGGSASGVVGSLAAALVAMVGRLTVGKLEDEDEGLRRKLQSIVEEADGLRRELLALADEDEEAFDRVMAAYKLPKATDEEKEKRKAAIQEALKGATEVPCRTAEACLRVLERARAMAEHGTPTAISDVGTAAYMAEAALHSALLNVDINLKYLKDEAFRGEYAQKREALAREAPKLREETLKLVKERM